MEMRQNGAKLVKIGVGRKRQICLHAFLLADLVYTQICASTCEKLNVYKLEKISENWKKLKKIDENWKKLEKIGKNWKKLEKIGKNRSLKKM